MSIRELIEAVEAGKARGLYGKMCDEAGIDAVDVMRADLHGSVDAALALMQAVLPGRGWSVHQAARRGYFFACVNNNQDGGIVSDLGSGAMADTPARALLLAILKAKEGDTP